MIKKTKTLRGFNRVEFEDGNGRECHLQESSASRNEGLIWLGCNDIQLKTFVPYKGWQEHSDNDIKKAFSEIRGGEVDSILVNNCMHLTQSQVKELLPYLQKFAETGEL